MNQEFSRIVSSTIDHDMYGHPDERYFRECYLHWIFRTLDEFLPSGEKIRPCLLDIGCGQGRLTIPTAKKYDQVVSTGIDLSEPAITQAREYAKTEEVENRCLFENSEALQWTMALEPETQDVIFLNEVIFYARDYLSLIEEAFRILKPGGLAFISFRSRYFNLAHAVNNGWFDKIDSLTQTNQGKVFGNDLTFSWHDCEDAEKILFENGFSIKKSVGIGIFSGLPGDPMAKWCEPSELSDQDQNKLFELEISVAEKFKNNGRYILFVASKN